MLQSGESSSGCVHAGETESLCNQMPQASQTGAEGMEDPWSWVHVGSSAPMSTKDRGGGGSHRGDALSSEEQRQAGQHSSTFPLDLFVPRAEPSGVGQGVGGDVWSSALS